MNNRSKVITIKRGDTLDEIARTHGHASGTALFGAKANADLRKARRTRRDIQPGDKVVVPSLLAMEQGIETRAALIQRVASRVVAYETLNKDIAAMRDALLAEIRSAHAQAKRTVGAVDLAATVVSLSRVLAKVGGKSVKAVNATGKALEKANKDLFKAMMEFRGAVLEDAVARPVLKTMTRNAAQAGDTARIVAQTFVEVWCD